MVGLPFDCLANPLGAVCRTFEKAVSSGRDPATFGRTDWGAVEVFRQFLFDQGGLSHVPMLDTTSLHQIQPNSLVRFRGMIQDMFDNEYYVGAYKEGSTWKTNKFTDVASYPMTSASEMQLWDRRLLYCIQIPGQNSWITESYSTEVTLRDGISQQREKRQRETEDMELIGCSDPESKNLLACSKKQREDGSSCEALLIQHETNIQNLSSHASKVLDFDINPLSCLVKIYDGLENDLKLNDVFEFIGVFTFDPELMIHNDDTDELSSGLCDDISIILPPSKVPRLHCIISRKLATHDFLSAPHAIEPNPTLVRGIRETLLGHFTLILGNDCLAANCLLLHLLSRVHARVEPVAVGKLSLNLTGFSKESISIFGNQLNLALESLLLFSQSIPLTIEYLNTTSLVPRKNYKTNRLISGVLQLAQGTHLTIDETQLNAGTLNASGVENIELLKSLQQWQKVDYDFEFYKMEMAADVQLLILSGAKSNILPADLVCPFRPSTVASALNASSSEQLQAWRWYLATLRSIPVTIEPAMQKVIEDDMVAARQENRSLGTDDFSRWLTMARLLSASFGETTISLEHWQMAKELERLIKERF